MCTRRYGIQHLFPGFVTPIRSQFLFSGNACLQTTTHDAQVGRLGAGAHEEHDIGVLQPLHDGHLLPEFLRHMDMTPVSQSDSIEMIVSKALKQKH